MTENSIYGAEKSQGIYKKNYQLVLIKYWLTFSPRWEIEQTNA